MRYFNFCEYSQIFKSFSISKQKQFCLYIRLVVLITPIFSHSTLTGNDAVPENQNPATNQNSRKDETTATRFESWAEHLDEEGKRRHAFNLAIINGERTFNEPDLIANSVENDTNETSDYLNFPNNEKDIRNSGDIPSLLDDISMIPDHNRFRDFWPPVVYVDNANQQNKDRYASILPAETDDLKILLDAFEHDLPDCDTAEKIVREAMLEHPKLSLIIKQLGDSSLYSRAKHPTRLLFVGPSGCGKTTLAEAIASACDMTCIFIKASSIATTYQNSGAQFFELLFRCLKNNPDHDFLVIIDEISAIAQQVANEKDLQQNKMATSFWLGLDQIRNERHICIIGTDNKDPETLPDQIKTRFKNNIFHFKPPAITKIVSFMKDCLGQSPKEDNEVWSCVKAKSLKFHNCSDAFLKNLAQCVSLISLREIEDLIDTAKALAIDENEDPYALVHERHMLQAFSAYTDSWFKKLWNSKEKYFKSMISLRACTLYAATAGMYMHFYTKQYREHGLFVTALASIINNYLPREITDSNDVGIITYLSQLLSNYKYRVFV